MRLAVLADIHANIPALEAVLADAQRQGADSFVVVGDHITGGPCPMETMQLLRSLKGWLIRGNTDNYLLDYHCGRSPEAWYKDRNWAPVRWVYHHIDEETLDFIRMLPEQLALELPDAAPIRAVHGSPRSPFEHLIPDRDPATLRIFRRAGILRSDEPPSPPLEAMLAETSEAVLICGHSHISWKQENDGRLALNPGSVGAPINGDVRAQYALLTWRHDRWQIEHRAIEYDVMRASADYAESGLLAQGWMARAFMRNVETGLNYGGLLVQHAFRVARAAGLKDESISDEIWEHAAATFDWEMVGKALQD